MVTNWYKLCAVSDLSVGFKIALQFSERKQQVLRRRPRPVVLLTAHVATAASEPDVHGACGSPRGGAGRSGQPPGLLKKK